MKVTFHNHKVVKPNRYFAVDISINFGKVTAKWITSSRPEAAKALNSQPHIIEVLNNLQERVSLNPLLNFA